MTETYLNTLLFRIGEREEREGVKRKRSFIVKREREERDDYIEEEIKPDEELHHILVIVIEWLLRERIILN